MKCTTEIMSGPNEINPTVRTDPHRLSTLPN